MFIQHTFLARINYRNNFNRMKEKHVLGSNIFKWRVCTIVVFPSLSAQLDITYKCTYTFRIHVILAI